MAAYDRTEDHRTAAKLRRAQAALTGAPGTLLLIGFLGRPLDHADPLCLMGSRAAFCQLPVDDASEDVAADRQAEHLVGKVDIADFLVVEIAHGELHQEPTSCGLSAAAPSRKAAGNGSSTGALRLTGSLTRTEPPGLPGTDPLIIKTPRSASAEITSRLCVVARSAPR